MITVRLPWPPKQLSPNARVHWSVKNRHAQQQKESAWALTQHAKRGFISAPSWTHNVRLTFNPPDRRRRDLDNMLAMMKPALDGIAMALGTDDQHFTLTLERGEPTKGGEVVAVITEGAEQ